MPGRAVSLEVRDATVFYGAQRVLDRVSLNAAGGEFIALLGALGCGKTTLLRAICGFVELTGGMIAVAAASPRKRRLPITVTAAWPRCKRSPRSSAISQAVGFRGLAFPAGKNARPVIAPPRPPARPTAA
jgi:ABC-type cobalamin/Fe3+-siderophores transport system ATPase subunit